jgi:hypothetical protein
MQIATIMAGKLTYTVLVGAAPVYRAGADGAPKLSRLIKRGTTAVLRVGDSIVELPGDIHQGSNRGTQPVQISFANLFPRGAPASVTVK